MYTHRSHHSSSIGARFGWWGLCGWRNRTQGIGHQVELFAKLTALKIVAKKPTKINTRAILP